MGLRAAAHALIVVGLLSLLAAPAARADDPASCPTPPVAYEGTDDVVREVRLAREDARTTCLAAREDADRAHADAERAHADAVAAADALGEPASPTDATVTIAPAQLDTIAGAVKPYGDAGTIALGVLTGLTIVGLLLMPAIRRYWT